jgi:hypothetical protein
MERETARAVFGHYAGRFNGKSITLRAPAQDTKPDAGTEKKTST